VSPTIAPAAPYAEARHELLAAAEAAGATLSSHAHPSPGPDGGPLATDVARFGAPVGEAAQVVLLLSGTHGVEGHAGSGLQRNLVASGRLDRLPPGVAVVLVHAVNPYGMAWTRRVDHENVDVNRNFVDPAHLPDNPLYDEVDHLLNPTDPELDPSDTSFIGGLMEFMGRVGELTAFRTLNGGQYSHPEGVQFGGQGVTWSRRTLEAIWDEQLPGARRAVNLDVHTGLGPTGGLTVFQTADEVELAAELGRRWYPQQMWRADRTTHDPIDHGLLGPGFDAWASARGDAAPAETATFVVEFGTLDVIKGITAFRADNWLHHHGDRDSPTGRAIVDLMLDQFYVDDDGWRTAVAEQGEAAIGAALDGIDED
jgi:hypothetical protein